MKIFKILLITLTGFYVFADESPRLGDTLPDFTLKDSEGKTHILHEYHNKTVILFTLGFG